MKIFKERKKSTICENSVLISIYPLSYRMPFENPHFGFVTCYLLPALRTLCRTLAESCTRRMTPITIGSCSAARQSGGGWGGLSLLIYSILFIYLFE